MHRLERQHAESWSRSLYIAMKSLYWSEGTLKKIMWCDDNKIKPLFYRGRKELDIWESEETNGKIAWKIKYFQNCQKNCRNIHSGNLEVKKNILNIGMQ